MPTHRIDVSPEAVAALYRELGTIPKTAAAAGVSVRTVSRRLRAAGVYSRGDTAPGAGATAALRDALRVIKVLRGRQARVVESADRTIERLGSLIEETEAGA